jgi:hypothetical protein
VQVEDVDGFLASLGLGTPCDASTAPEDCDVLAGPVATVSELANESVVARGDSSTSWSSFGVRNEVSIDVTAGGTLVGASLGVEVGSTLSFEQGEEVAFGIHAGDVEFGLADFYDVQVLAFNYAFDCVASTDPNEVEPACDGFQVVTAANR